MPRKGGIERRELVPDPMWSSRLVTRFINCMQKGGKRSTAERVFYKAMEIVADRSKGNPLEIFEQAMRNAMPHVEVRGRRVGGATYQVPIEVRADRRIALGIRWLITFARQRSGRAMQERLAAELMDAAQNAGGACRRREEMHKTAEANRAFAHYRW
jgi:small subunit ribosomal protein S7